MFARFLVCIVCSVAALPLAAEEPLWEWVTPRPQGHDLFAAATGNGVTVAVGRNGTVVTSTDGIEWRAGHTATAYPLSDVAWANGLFVAVGGEVGFEFSPGPGVILTSDDGIHWIERHREDYLTLESVVWTGAQFVAVGIGDEALLSSDGLNWSNIQFEDSEFLWDLAWNGTRLVAIGRDGYFGGPPSYFTSENGEEWQQLPFDRDYAPAAIAASGSRFVAVGSEHDALVSDDGLTWTVAPYESSRELEVIVSVGNGFLAIGNDVVGTSLDGYVWSIEDVSTESRVNGLAWLGDGYLAVGEDGFLMSSTDGSEWTPLSTSIFGPRGSQEIDEMATNGSTTVGVGAGIITGRHGTDWSWRAAPVDMGPTAVIWTGSAFWAAGSYGVVRSIDGQHWAPMLVDYDLRLFDIAWNGRSFVAVGRRSTLVGETIETQDVVLTSADGQDWAAQLFDLDGTLFTVGWTGSEFVAAGNGSVYLTSPDGAIWQEHLQLLGVTMSDMAWDGHRLVAVGSRLEHGGAIYSTTDGLQWVESSLPETPQSEFRDVTWTGTHFVAVARTPDPSIFVSEDGFSWSVESTGTGVWPVSVVGDATKLYATGRGLQIIRRTEPLADRKPPRRPGRRVAPVGGTKRAVAPVQR